MDNSDRNSGSKKALLQLLKSIVIISHDDLDFISDAFITIDCHDGMFLIISEPDWLCLLMHVDDLFCSHVQERMVSATILHHVRIMYDACGFPFNEDQLQNCIQMSYSKLCAYSQQEYEFLFPLRHVKFIRNETYSVPLANAILHPAANDSMLVDVARRSNNERSKEDLSKCGYLQLLVSGDGDTRRLHALMEAENALKVLRFVGEWRSEIRNNRVEWKNPVVPITTVTDTSQLFIGYPAGNRAGRVWAHIASSSAVTLSELFFRNARDYYGLEDINYHCQNPGNPISEQLIRALTVYDSGIQACTDWEAVYLFVHCINIAVMTGQGSSSKLPKDVRTLIQFGNGYLSTNRGGSNNAVPVKQSWTALIREKVDPFNDFYELRSRIVHGNEMNFGRITSEVLKDARELAHNSVRIVAYLARQKNWSDHDTVKNWFEAKRRKWEAEDAKQSESNSVGDGDSA